MGNDVGKLEPPKLFGRKKVAKPSRQASPAPVPAPVAEEPPTAVVTTDEHPAPAEKPVESAEKPAKGVRRPLAVHGAVAALIGGLVAGVVLSGLTWAAEAATDPADSGRLQAVMVVAIFVLSVVAGALVLRLLTVPSAGTVAFLGSALVAVVAVVALSNHFDDAVGAVAAVVLSAVAYPLSRWVTVRYIDAA